MLPNSSFASALTRRTVARMHLRPATPEDVPLLRRWDRQPHVASALGADASEEHDWLGEWFPPPRGWLELLIVEHDDRPIAVVQIIDPAEDETQYWGPTPRGLRALDVWIGEASDLGRGYGTQLMQLVIRRCFADAGVEAILLDPLAENLRACRFYERLGFRAVERQKFGEDDCIVYRLDRPAAAG